VELITLEAQSERATLVPQAGCQCLGYQVGSLEVIAGPAGPDEWRAHPFSSGIPILFPWPGRVADGRFTFAGREHRLPVNEPRGHAMHGLTYNREFHVRRRGPFFVRAEFDTRSAADFAQLWPWAFVLAIDYEIGNGLRIKTSVRNTGDAVMPFGLGAHPYFHLPPSARGNRGAVTLELCADSRWPLDSRLIPSGPPQALSGSFDLRRARPLGADTYDDAFQMQKSTAPVNAGGSAPPRARLVDPALGMALEVSADPAFGQFVVYAPPDRGVIALEPYTCAPDAFNLDARGVAAGMLTLKPGESFEAGFEIRLSAP